MEADLQLVRLEERRVLQGMPVAAPAAASGSGSSGHASATYLIARHGNEVDVSLNGVLVKEQSIDQGRLTISALTTGAQFIVDMSGGNPIPKGGLTLIGAQAGTGVQNSLVIQPGNPLTPFATVTYSLLSGDQGSITLTGTSSSGPAQTSTINFSNITSIEDDTAADSRVLELDRGPEQLTLAAAPSIGSQPALVLSSSLGPSVTFVDPATSLSIEAAGQPADSLQLASFDLVASLAVEMAGTVTLSGPVQTGGLSISADTIQVNSNVVAGPSAQFVARTEIDVAQSASLAALASIDLEAPSIQQVGNLRLLGPGLVRLDGGTGGTVIVSGRIDAADLGPSGNGGNVQVLGNLIALTGQAVVDVSGSNPGSVVIGGNEHDPSLGPLASRTFIGPQALIMADGIGNASGGSVVVWSSQLTVFEGDIEARGGTTGGNGGFAEVSSTGSIDFQGQTDLSASQGQGGNLLLDPTSIILTDRQSNFTPFTPPDFTETLLADVGATFLDVTAGGSFSNVSASATITLQSTTTISVETALNLFQATGQNNVSLVLQAEGAIIIDQAITADGTGTITIQANDIVPLLGDVLIGAPITANAAISISGDNVIINDQVNSGSGTISIDANGGTVTTGLGGVLTSTNTSATAITIQDASTVALGNIMDTGGLVLGVGSNVGSVSQNISDTIQANSITASTSGDVILGNSGNVIDSLGVMSVGGALDVQDAIADRTARFTISGAITADSATIGNTLGSITDDASITTNLPLGINLTAIGITQSSSSTLSSGAGPIALVAGTGTVTLAGDLTTTGGDISVSGTRITQNDGTLDSGSGTISLDSGGSIMDLSHGVLTSSSTSDTAISLADASSITLGSVVVTSGGLVLGVSANVGSVTANSTIQANSVTASTSGAVNLQSVNNEIDSLGAMDVGGSLQVNDAVQDVAAMFTITGAIGASSVTIQNTQGSITVNQGITTTAGSIGLAAIGINQNSTLDTSAGTGEIALDGTTGAINLAGNMNTASGRISVNGAGITQSAGTDLDAGSGTITLNADDDAMTLAGTLTTTNTSTTAVTIDHVTTLQLGAVTASFGTLSLTATGNITGGSLLDVAVLTGTGGGTMSFLNRNNEIAAVSMLTSDGTLTLKDNVALNVNGTVTDDLDGSEVSIEVLSAALTLAGDIETTSGNGIQIQLEGVGITQSSGTLDSGSGNGSITLNGGAGAVSLAGFMTTTDGVAGAPGGDISVTGAGITQSAGTLYSGLGTITLDGTAAAISLSGTLTSTNGSNAVTIQDATTLQLGTVNAGGGTVSLTTTGAITQVGALDAHVLNGNSGGAVQLDNSNNQVTTLSNFERGGDFTLDDTIALNVNGVLTQGNTANNVSITVVGAGLTLANSITISGSDANGNPTSISLSGNAITQSAGTISAGTGTITLNGGTGAVNLSGTLSSTNSTSGVDAITIDGATIASGGTISAASGTVALDATGTSNPITQTGGHITAGILTVDSAGSIQINGNSNQIASLGAVKHGGDLTLDDDHALEVDGPITEVTNSSNVTIDAVGALTLAGGITSTGSQVNLTGAGIMQSAGIVNSGLGTLTLDAGSGAITQTGGGLAGHSLTATSGGAIQLGSSSNQIALLGSISRGGDFTFENSVALEVNGPITAGTTTSNVSITVLNSGLTLAGNITTVGTTTGVSLSGNGLTLSSGTVNAGSGTITLSGGSSTITQSSAILVANSLAASSTGGAIQLGSSNNQIAVLDTVSRGGDFTLEDKVALEVDGPITGGTIANNVSITVLNFGLTLAGDISSTGGTNGINLTAAAISQSAGTVSAGLGTLTLDAVSGAITQTAGGLAGNTLTATSAGAILLGSNTNQIAFLGSISRGGDFTFEDNAALEVDGPINLGDTSSSVSIDVLNFGLTLAGNIVTVGATNGISLTGVGITQSSGSVAAALGTLTLDAGSGGVTQNGGQLAANSLTASSGGAIQIDGNDNQIAVLGAISRGGDFTLVDNLALEVNGPITAGTAASNVSITDAFFGLTLFGDITTTGSTNGINLTAVGITQSSGTLDAGLGTLTLDSGADSITQSTGMIEANTLVANSGGAIELTNTANQISVLSSISLDGDFTLVNDVVLQVNGPIAPGNNNGTVSITVNGAALTLAGDITAGTNGNDINLTAVGITQAAAGALNSGTGTITLDGGAGAVGLAGGMTAGGDIKVTGAGITQSAGTLDTSSGTGSITFDGTGAISLASGMRTDSGDIGVTGVGITQTAASTLDSTSGLITLDGGAGAIGLAGGMTTSGNIKVTGAAITQSAGTLDTSSGTGSITLDGTGAIGLAGRMLTSSGEIGVTGVGITQSPVSTLDAGSGAITLDAGGGAISMEGGLNSTNTTTSVTIHDATSVGLGTITASGAVILGVGQDITGAVTQFGSISTPDLVLSGTNSFTLTSAQNSIAALAGTTGSTSVTDSTGISLAGLADQGNLTLQTAGPISQTAAISVTGTSSFSAGANAINLATANDLVGAVSLNNSGAADVTLDNAVGLVVGTSSVGSGNLELTAGGSISQTGTITQAAGAVSTRFVVTTPSADVLLGMANDLSGPITVTASGSGSVRDLNLQSTDASTRLVSIPISLADLTLTFDNAPVALPTLNLSGSLQVLGGGIVSESGSLSVVGTTQLTTGAFNIDLTSANRLVGAV
ncbi:MAG TPA: hypothetical protein VHV55_03595, partial [Pirellulales bacterium]|nr:hypothetical protein [Pirellulales bacterium]